MTILFWNVRACSCRFVLRSRDARTAATLSDDVYSVTLQSDARPRTTV
jgi:hypothetical protein